MCQKYQRSRAKIISNSLFDLVDPKNCCVKHRKIESTEQMAYTISNGNFKEFMRKPMIQSRIIRNLSNVSGKSYSGFVSLTSDENSNTALKLLSIFDYITYEIIGGEEPEIFIRLNDANKIRNIVMGNVRYSNSYVRRAKEKHDRDVHVLNKFFSNLSTDKERWNYIENYFLGYDVLDEQNTTEITKSAMKKAVDKEHSYSTTSFRSWTELMQIFDECDHGIIKSYAANQLPIPEYIKTVLKDDDSTNDIMFSWPSKDTLMCAPDISDTVIRRYEDRGWNAFKFGEVDINKLKEVLV